MKAFNLIKSNEAGCCGSVPRTDSCEVSETNNQPEQTKLDRFNLHLPVAIIGAGPVGLAAAAHLALAKVPFVVLESGGSVGTNMRKWQHVQLFSPWQFNINKAARKLLEATSWTSPSDDDLPTGKMFIEQYLKPLSEVPVVKNAIRYHAKVTAISRKQMDKMKSSDREKQPFEVYIEKNGDIEIMEARAIIDATGTWGNPNPATSNGVWFDSEKQCAQHIEYGIPNVQESAMRYADKTVAVIGGGHSAINTLLELAALQKEYPETKLLWILRKKQVENVYGGQEKDALAARGALGTKIHALVDAGKIKVHTPFYTTQVKSANGKLELVGQDKDETVTIKDIDELIVNTGSRPDFSIEQALRLSIDPVTESVAALAPLIDPNVHSCGTVRAHGETILRQPEQHLYIVGMKSYGRAPTFLMATGYEQVRSITAYFAGDIEAAQRVELDLPETGVCSINLTDAGSDTCCK